MALLMAVQHVDEDAFNHLIEEKCGLVIGGEGDEVYDAAFAPEFVVDLDVGANEIDGRVEYDLVRLCGTDHRLHPSEEYLEALKKIAAFDDKLDPGVDVEVSVKLRFSRQSSTPDRSVASMLLDVAKAEGKVAEEWKVYDESTEKEGVVEGEMRCKFVLKPMHADLRGVHLHPEAMEAIEQLFRSGVHFSEIVLAMCYERGSSEDGRASKRVYGQLLRSFFSCTHYVEHIPYSFEDAKPDQAQVLNLMCDSGIPARDFEAMCSAMALTQTTKKLSLELIMNGMDQTSRVHWWKWLAYALFSKRAEACSSIKDLTLSGLLQLTVEEVRAFASILTSEHPEEALFGTPRGLVEDRDATLASGSPIRWEFDDEGHLVADSKVIALDEPIPLGRTFSDNGESEWVNVVVPGFGRCQVERRNLNFHPKSESNRTATPVTSLALRFLHNDMTRMMGICPFFEAVGSSLELITLSAPDSVDDNVILGCCPNLQELTVSTSCMDLQFDFRTHRATNSPIPRLDTPKSDVVQVAKRLSDSSHYLSKCVRRLRASVFARPVRLADVEIAPFQVSMDALLHMLETNKRLEYLSVQVAIANPAEEYPVDKFKAYDQKSVYQPVPIKCKAALLSAVAAAAEGEKKRKLEGTRPMHALGQVDHHVLSNIFSFAADTVLRSVYFECEYPEHFG